MFLAIKELMYARLRYALVALIMFLLSFLVLFVSGLAQGLAADNAAGIMNMDTDSFVVDEEAEYQLTRSLIENKDQETIEAFSDDAEKLGIHMAQIEDGEDALADIAFMSFSEGSVWLPDVIEGNQPTEAGELVADESLKEEGFEVGSTVIDSGSDMTFVITGFSENQRFGHSPILNVSEEDWIEMGRDDAFTVSAYILPTTSDEEAEDLTSQLESAEVVTHDDVLSGIPGYSAEQGSLTMMIVFLFIISAFVLAAFFYVITIQKLTQFGILKAIGAKSSQLATAVFLQIIVLSFISVGLGISVTLLVGSLLPQGLPFHLDVELIGLLALLFFGVAMIGSLLSIVKVMKIDPLKAIGGGQE